MASAKTPQAEPATADGVPAVPAQSEPIQAEPVSATELNAWRRGFTPQAEIWNGRLAMVGLSFGLTVLLIARLSFR
jgi:hypothetical protein